MLGIGLEGSTALYLDGVYLGGGRNLLGELQDVARIEVLRGPQGTLFGKNAAAGAVSVTTAAPDEIFGASVTGGIGTNKLRYASTTINAPLSDTVLTRTNVSRSVSDGVFGNTDGGKRFGATDSLSGRTKLTWLATDKLTADFSLDATNNQGTRLPVVLVESGFNPAFGNGVTTFPLSDAPQGVTPLDSKNFPNTLVIIGEDGTPVRLDPGYGKATSEGASAKFTYDFNDTLSLSSITSYRTSFSKSHTGSAGLARFSPLAQPTSGYVSQADEKRKEVNQEFRLSGSNDFADWFVGTNYSQADNSSLDNMALPNQYVPGVEGATGRFGDQKEDVSATLKSLALFGDMIIPLTETVNVSVGARYSKDRTKVNWKEVQQRAGQVFYTNVGPGGIQVKDSWSNLSGRMVFDWTINDDVNTYAGITQGYKAGGFNTSLAPYLQDPSDDESPSTPVHPGASVIKPFNEEKSVNYEVGLKTALMDSSLFINTSLFYTKYKNYQLQTPNPANTRLSLIDTADAFTRGIDMDASWLATDELTVGMTMALMQAEFKQNTVAVDKGQDLLRAPKLSGSINLDYLQSLEVGDIRYNMTYSYSTTQRLTNQKLSGLQVEGADLTLTKDDIYSGSFDNLNARITFTPRGERWEAALWATNILDKAYRTDGHFELTNSTYSAAGGVARPYIRNAPRAVGFEMSYVFGEL